VGIIQKQKKGNEEANNKARILNGCEVLSKGSARQGLNGCHGPGSVMDRSFVRSKNKQHDNIAQRTKRGRLRNERTRFVGLLLKVYQIHVLIEKILVA
jgi:hypothetical protein